MSDLGGLFHAEHVCFFALASTARDALRLDVGIAHALLVFLRSAGVMERAAERRDAEKRSMFPRQMGIIHAARVSAALRAPEYTVCVHVKDDT